MGNRFALIISNATYDDAALRKLPSAVEDIAALEPVLHDPDLGDFSVTVVQDQPWNVIVEQLAGFLRWKAPDDLLWVHFSGHGLKDADGELYFAGRSTRPDLLLGSAVPAALVHKMLMVCPAQQKVLILDCCYGGAYSRLMSARSAGIGKERIDIKERFASPEGRGTVVISSSSSIQFAYEGATVQGRTTPSVFTRILVDSIESGRGDRDGDGNVGLAELYETVHDRMAREAPHQEPEYNGLRVRGQIVVARSKNVARTVALSPVDAQTGCSMTIDVAGSQREIVTPPGVQDGHVERYVGLGLEKRDSGAGDLILTFRVAQESRSFGALFATWWHSAHRFLFRREGVALLCGLVALVLATWLFTPIVGPISARSACGASQMSAAKGVSFVTVTVSGKAMDVAGMTIRNGKAFIPVVDIASNTAIAETCGLLGSLRLKQTINPYTLETSYTAPEGLRLVMKANSGTIVDPSGDRRPIDNPPYTDGHYFRVPLHLLVDASGAFIRCNRGESRCDIDPLPTVRRIDAIVRFISDEWWNATHRTTPASLINSVRISMDRPLDYRKL